MSCIDCHSGNEMHGVPTDPGEEAAESTPPTHRYDGVQSPRCESCHEVVSSSGQDSIVMHQMHGDKLSCQVCHSVSYTSCDGCHVAVSEETGNPFFETDGSYLNFLIGRNVLNSAERPYLYVPVRHVPVAETSFEYYGEDLLPNFNALETWKYTTPHNIQRLTPQNESCDACHGNPDLFLTADKVAENELEANDGVIVDSVPPAMTSGN
jgi:thiosulfate/3-mercaptopyruvate sulfurtransferase